MVTESSNLSLSAKKKLVAWTSFLVPHGPCYINLMDNIVNKVFLDPQDYIQVVAAGMQTYDTVKSIETEVQALSHNLREQQKPVKILIELAENTGQGLPARRAAREFLTNLDYDKIGMYGGRLFLKHIIDLIIAGSLRTDKVKNFYTKEEATAWLAQG